MRLDADGLAAACADSSHDAGILIHTVLEPLAGRQAPVKPAAYEGGRFQEDWRWWGKPPEKTRVIVIDNVPSQANRLEAALQGVRSSLGLPEVVLDLSSIPLPSHLPSRLSGFRFPHRNADAYLRDAMLDGDRFPSSEVGKAVFSAHADDPAALFHWFPQALLFGYWQSHLGKKRSQAKLARSWVSEIAGYGPATDENDRTRIEGLKGDPLNLSVEEQVTYDPEDLLGSGWEVVEASQRAGRKQKDSLAEIGHGQVPVPRAERALAGVSFQAIEQRASVSLAGLRRVHCANQETSARGRALLAALGLVAHVCAFGGAFSLRSGCDLRPVSSSWTWLGAETTEEMEPLTAEAAASLSRECVGAARDSGLTQGGGWGNEPLELTPGKGLADAIRKTYPR